MDDDEQLARTKKYADEWKLFDVLKAAPLEANKAFQWLHRPEANLALQSACRQPPDNGAEMLTCPNPAMLPLNSA